MAAVLAIVCRVQVIAVLTVAHQVQVTGLATTRRYFAGASQMAVRGLRPRGGAYS